MKSLIRTITFTIVCSFVNSAFAEVDNFLSPASSQQCGAQLKALRFLGYQLGVTNSLHCSDDGYITGGVDQNSTGAGGHGYLPTENSKQCIDEPEISILSANAYAFAKSAGVKKIEIRRISCRNVGYYGYRLEFNWSTKPVITGEE